MKNIEGWVAELEVSVTKIEGWVGKLEVQMKR